MSRHKGQYVRSKRIGLMCRMNKWDNGKRMMMIKLILHIIRNMYLQKSKSTTRTLRDRIRIIYELAQLINRLR